MHFANLHERLMKALKEDGAFHDITTHQLPNFGKRKGRAIVIAKENGVLSGAILAKPLFSILDPRAKIHLVKKEGSLIKKGQKLAEIHAKTKAILGGERIFLNLACHLSGIATLTHQFVKIIDGTKAKILDTRKTM